MPFLFRFVQTLTPIVFLFLAACNSGTQDAAGGLPSTGPPSSVAGRWAADFAFSYDTTYASQSGNATVSESYSGIAMLTLTLADDMGVVIGNFDYEETSLFLARETDLDSGMVVTTDSFSVVDFNWSVTLDAIYAPPLLDITRLDVQSGFIRAYESLEITFQSEDQGIAENQFCGFHCGTSVLTTVERFTTFIFHRQ